MFRRATAVVERKWLDGVTTEDRKRKKEKNVRGFRSGKTGGEKVKLIFVRAPVAPVSSFSVPYQFGKFPLLT